jgi:hypothetical protein
MGTWEGLALGLNTTSREAPPAPPVLDGGTSALLGSSDDAARTTKRTAGMAVCLLVLKPALRACKVHARGCVDRIVVEMAAAPSFEFDADIQQHRWYDFIENIRDAPGSS